MSTLEINTGHISLSTIRILEKRDKEVKGHSFYRGAEPVTTFFKDYRFTLRSFKTSYPAEHERIEAAIPIDLLYLHIFAAACGYDEIVISPDAEPDLRLPWYGGGNRLMAVGSALDDRQAETAARVPRQFRTGGVIEGFHPAQFRDGRLELLRQAEPEMAFSA